MLELAKHFINTDCIIYFLGGSTISGVIKEISENGNAILLENGKDTDLINLEFVTRIRKYPLDKNGKRKGLRLDWFFSRKNAGINDTKYTLIHKGKLQQTML